jgi:osmotically-inducible protein OsmY
MTARLLACLLVAAPLLGGCLSDRTFGESFDDASAATEIKTKLTFNGGPAKFGEVDVAVVDRFVLLSGRVPSEADRKEAERLAWTVSAVDEVANELQIENWDLGRDMNDMWITEQVRMRLLADNNIKGTNFNIQVHSGVVYLLGLARSEDELRSAAEHASPVNGVQKVVSYVKMRERGAPPADADISVAAAAPVDQQGQPVPVDTTQGAIRIAPPAAAPAPIVGPSIQPTTRGQYTDPYAPGAAPPPGASNNNIGLLQSSSIPPVSN